MSMFRSISKPIIFTFLLWCFFMVIDRNGTICFTLNNKANYFSIDYFFLALIGCIVLFELGIFMLKYVINLIKKDVLLSNHSFHGDKESIEVIQSGNKDKIVLSRNQFDEAAILIVKTLGAITAGLMNEARRLLVSLRKIVGDDAIIDILMLKIYKGEKNFDKMEQLSQKLMQNEDIQLVGMKAALEAQMQKKEFTEALKTVNQAFEVRQDLYWVVSSAFLLRAQNNDWLGALEVLESGIEKNITPDKKAARLKAVALFELAQQALKDNDKTNFFKFVTQALQENNKLIPAALDLADYYIKNDNQTRKAEKVLYDMWIENPCYEVAMAYLKLFKDTKNERIQRMEKLALSNNKRPSLNNLILAELYLKAKKYAKAKTECKIFLLKNPATQKMAEIIEELDEKTHKKDSSKIGFMQSLTQKFTHIGKNNISLDSCPKDFQWVCANCGHIEDHWTPICAQCGEIGRSYWHLYVDKDLIDTDEN